jgi:hypothetical protein
MKPNVNADGSGSKGPLKTEPALITGGSISLLLYAVFGIIKSNGILIDDATQGHIETIIYVVLAMPAVTGALVRFGVYSPASVDEISKRQYRKGLASWAIEPQPEIPPPGNVVYREGDMNAANWPNPR